MLHMINKYEGRERERAKERKGQIVLPYYICMCVYMHIYTVCTGIPWTACLYIRRDQSHFVTIYTYRFLSSVHMYTHTYIYMRKRR